MNLSVLFVGNSYTYFNDMPSIFHELLIASGLTAMVDSSVSGGYTLGQHADAEDSVGSQTITKIKSGGWHYVVLQEQSRIPSVPEVREERMYPAARELHRLISSAGAKTVFYSTWARPDGDELTGHPTFDSMQQQLVEGYDKIAVELGCLVAPVGTAWSVLREKLGDESIVLWGPDRHHPSLMGSYLAACVIFGTITGKPSTGLQHTAGLPLEQAQMIQEVADQVVLAR